MTNFPNKKYQLKGYMEENKQLPTTKSDEQTDTKRFPSSLEEERKMEQVISMENVCITGVNTDGFKKMMELIHLYPIQKNKT